MSIDIKTKYITADDFKVYFGIDLAVELKNDGNPSNTVQAFIKRIEDRIAIYLDAFYFRQIDKEYPEFSDFQKECYQKALLEQALYVFKNGDIIADSGYNFDNGEISSNKLILEKSVSQVAKGYLMKCGLLTRKIKNQRRYGFFRL